VLQFVVYFKQSDWANVQIYSLLIQLQAKPVISKASAPLSFSLKGNAHQVVFQI